MRAFLKFHRGIMRMPLPWRAWLMLLITANMVVPLFFLHRLEAQVVLAALLASLVWAELMKRVFELEVLICPHCGGPRKVLAFLIDSKVVRRILEHLDLPTDPPTIAAARPPPELALPFT